MPRDPFPSDAEIQAANAGLVGVVRRHLPMGFYARATHWSLWSTVALVRMADTVEAAMTLIAAGADVDGRTLIRSLYEQVVTYAWIAVDPGPRHKRWFAESVWADLRLHNDATTFGERILTENEVALSRRILRLDSAKEADDAAGTCKGQRKRKGPAAELLLPAVPERAKDGGRPLVRSGVWPPRAREHAQLPGPVSAGLPADESIHPQLDERPRRLHQEPLAPQGGRPCPGGLTAPMGASGAAVRDGARDRCSG